MITVAAEATRLRIAFRKNVHGPAADELDAGQRDLFHIVRVVAAGLRSLPGTERDVSVFVSEQSSIRNRTARHVASQVFQHLVGRGVRCRGSLDVGDPLDGFQWLEPVFERRGILQRRPFAVEFQFASGLSKNSHALRVDVDWRTSH